MKSKAKGSVSLEKIGIHLVIGGRIWQRRRGGVLCHGSDLCFFSVNRHLFFREREGKIMKRAKR